MANDHNLGRRVVERLTQEGVVADAVAKRRGVVAKFADLGCDFVDETQAIADTADSGVGEELGLVVTSFECSGDRCIVEIKAVVADE